MKNYTWFAPDMTNALREDLRFFIKHDGLTLETLTSLYKEVSGGYRFFLGGQDLEMVEIAKLLAEAGQEFVDKKIGWGAKASIYAEEILQAVTEGRTPVLVELELDIEVPEQTIVVDHHDDWSNMPASIYQVAKIVGRDLNHWQKLVAENDRGYIPAMIENGYAKPEEVLAIRLADRNAQGVTPEQEIEAEQAVASAEVVGKLTIVKMAHSKSATVTDRLFGKTDQLIILSGDGEVNFFGNGAICSALKEKFEGWGGGSGFGKDDGIGYWGGYPNHDEVLNFVMGKVNQTYTYAILDPRPIPVAIEANDKVFTTGPVVGIEVTVPALATRCVANIDPQHSEGNHELAAIEVAVTGEIPLAGSVLATVRADLDSIGAMAIFSLRSQCIDITSATDRIGLIATSDKFARGRWQGVKALPTVNHLFDDSTASTETDTRLAPIASAISDFKIAVADRVETLKKWLMTGEEPVGYREKFIAERQALAKAIADGTINAKSVAEGMIAQVISTHRAATSIGYCLAPVVVALNPTFSFQGSPAHAKFTICQFTPGYVDLKAVLAELTELEAGWGGSPTIGGSPQGVSSTLTIEQVVEAVAKHLLK